MRFLFARYSLGAARCGQRRRRSIVAAVVATRRPIVAGRPADLGDEFGALKAEPIQWRGVFMSASRKAQLLFC
jgi:hypothetical protein